MFAWYQSAARVLIKCQDLVSMKYLKLIALKCHDCHVLMQQLLLVGIHDIMPKNVRKTTTKFCLFFNAIRNIVIDSHNLDELEHDVVINLCQLEMYFSSSYFDIMIHLILYPVRETRFCCPIFLRRIYLVEWYLKILKGIRIIIIIQKLRSLKCTSQSKLLIFVQSIS